MARLLLIICFVFTFSFGRAIEPNIEDTIVPSGEGIKSLLLSGEHTKRAKLINHLNHSGFFSQLESFSTEYKLDSIVIKNWSEESQSIENSFRYNYYLENEGTMLMSKYMHGIGKKMDGESQMRYIMILTRRDLLFTLNFRSM